MGSEMCIRDRSRSSTDVIFTSNHSHLPLTQEATASSSLGYYIARRVARGLVPHPTLPYSTTDHTLYVETPRSTCVPNEPAYITYMTSATQINMMRMVLVPAPIIYPHIPIAPVEPLLPVHPLPVAQTTSSNTDVPRSSTSTKNLESSTSVTQSWPASTTQICTASTSATLPPIHTIKLPVYAPIATLDLTQTPPPTILITDTHGQQYT